MELNTLTHQVIALAGIAQAAALVQQLATTGKANEQALETTLGSLLKTESDSVLDVYGNNLANLKMGLTHLATQLTGYEITYQDEARYAASMVFLEQQLSDQTAMLKTISVGLERAKAQTEHFDLLHENVLANLGDTYLQTVSKLQPRIMVNGVPDYLSRTETANKIRACLLGGIRSAMLWKQCGGRRWKFLLFRKKIQVETQRLLALI
ncbi:MAG: high frequency lysogenization protein HflD [Methylococcales bacterium]|nr:high frequency lysogenization protein HflD [Methylococcales bacterium]MDD5755621.1 high frequency lysogenization protein HflD [Methylococcales bacterium]